MVNIIKRARQLRELLWTRTGPGALILPKEVLKISMEFHEHIEGGHRGARRFWREMLPRIKYRNPAIPIEIKRHSDPLGPSLLNIYTTSKHPSLTTTTTLVPESTEPTHSVDIREAPELEILAQLVSRTGATELKPTEEEQLEWKEIEEFKARSEADRQDVKTKLLAQRREEELLRLARGEVAASA